MIGLQDAVSLISLTREEQNDLSWLEGRVDTALVNFDGSPLIVTCEKQVSPKVAYALQRKFEEEGGWRVGIAYGPGAKSPANEWKFQFVPMYYTMPVGAKKTTGSSPKNKNPLPPLVLPADTFARLTAKRLLVRMPTRGRPALALEALAAYRNKAGCAVQIEVVIDSDDETMQSAEVLQRLHALECTVTSEFYLSKIEAVNGGRVKEWDVLLLASDDMVPVADDYALRVLAAMEQHWPHLDGALYFDDGFQGRGLCTLPIIGRRLYNQFGYVYHPHYKSLFCDLEQTELWTQLGRLTYVDEKIIEHRHHIWGKAEIDATYERNDALEGVDKETYERRKALCQPHAQWRFDAPPLWLSILICTVPERKKQLNQLLENLWLQNETLIGSDMVSFKSWNRMRSSRSVEICVDDGAGTIGEKRQRLLERAKGHFVAFVDDDDLPARDYVARMVQALVANPTVDCTSLEGIITTDGALPQRFQHSIQHTEWKTEGDVYVRPPNHLNAIRRELALQVGFVSKNHGEDHDFSMRLRPLLKTEASTGDSPLYYYFYNSNK